MNILICDDEKEINETVTKLISGKYADKHNILCFCSEKEIETFLHNKNISFDIAFMDIELGKGDNGIEVAYHLKKLNPNIEIVYITGYADKYDEDIFEKIKPYGLLRKPVKEIRMFKYIDEISAKQANIEVICKGNKLRIPLSNILYIEHEKRKVYFVSPTGKVAVYMKLNEVQNLLPNYFIRCHNSYIVNCFNVDSINNRQFVLSTGTAVPISRSYSEIAKKQFLLFKGGCM